MRIHEWVKTYFVYCLTFANVVVLYFVLQKPEVFSTGSTYVAKIYHEYQNEPSSIGKSIDTSTDFEFIDIQTVVDVPHSSKSSMENAEKNVLVTVSLDQGENYKKMQKMTYGIAEKITIVEKTEIVIYDVSKPIPKDADQIECLSLKFANPPYIACLHSNEEDTFLSRGIRTNFVWEPGLQDMIREFFEDHTNATFLDLGANIGTHSLYAANLNASVQVLAIEPFPKNVIRIHKAAQLNKTQNRLKIIMAPISNKRGSVVFNEIEMNIGGNGIVVKPAEIGKKGFESKSILFDDLTPFIRTEVVFLKMDIEAAECHVFENAHKLFTTFDIKFIIMEILYTKNEGLCCFDRMLNFLKGYNYRAFPFPYQFNKNNPLNFTEWQKWNVGEIYFEKFYT